MKRAFGHVEFRIRPGVAVVVLSACLALGGGNAGAAGSGEEVEVTSGVVTAMTCAKEAKETGNLAVISNCPLAETVSGLVVYDVAAEEIYLIAPKKLRLYELEKAFGGGSVDVTGVVVDAKDGIPVLEVTDYTVNPRPKPGSFKGCL